MLELIGVYIFIIVVVFITLIRLYIKQSHSYWKNRNIPYIEPSLPFGNFENPLTNKTFLGFYFKKFYDEFKAMGTKGGGVYTYSTPIFITADPEYNKHILVKDFQHFYARGFYSNEKQQPESINLLTVDDDRWRSLRTKLTPTFTSAKMRNMFHTMLVCSKALEEHVERYAINKDVLDIRDSVSRLTADIIGSCAFGIDCNSFQDTKFYQLLQEMFRKSTDFFKQSFCAALPKLARFLRIPLLPRTETEYINNSLNKTVKFRTENKIKRNDFLQMLIEMGQSNTLSMDEIRAQSILFFLGGYETSATTLTFALFELAYNQEIQEKLRDEIHSVLSTYNNIVTYEAVQDMKYMDAVMYETLRKYPPIATVKRKCTKDYKLPNSNIIIEKGTLIFVPILGFHYDPDFFPDPEKFLPSRFLEENVNKIVPYSYLPFGEGPRNCIGERFGKLQVKIGLMTLINKYKFTLNSQMKLPLPYARGLASTQNILLDVELAI